MADPGVTFDPEPIYASGNVMQAVAEQLQKIREAVERAHLPFWALGLAGEPGRSKYETHRQDELDQVTAAIKTANDTSESLLTTGRNYATADNGAHDNVNKLLYDVGWVPGKDGKFHQQPYPSTYDTSWPPSYTGGDSDIFNTGSLSSQETTLLATLRGAVGATAVAGLAKDYLNNEKWLSTWQTRYYTAEKISRLATMSQATQKVLTTAGRLSIAAAMAAATWEAVVVPDDFVIDDAVRAWANVAYDARKAFGADTKTVHDDLNLVWNGPAAGLADEGLLTFITAGVELADRADNRARGLHDVVVRLNQILDIAFWVAIGSLAAIFTVSVIPQAWLVKERLGATLAKTILTLVGLFDAVVIAVAAGTVSGNQGLTGTSPQNGLPARTFKD